MLQAWICYVMTLYSLSINFLLSRKYSCLALWTGGLSGGGQITDFSIWLTRKRGKVTSKNICVACAEIKNGRKPCHPTYNVAKGLQGCSLMQERREAEPHSLVSPRLWLRILCLPWECTAIPRGRVLWGSLSVFCFATVLFQLIKLLLLQNVNSNFEAERALLQELSELFLLNEAVSAGAFGKTSFSRVLYNLVALTLSWELNAFFDWFPSGLPWFNVHFLITALSVPWKWKSHEHLCCSTSV